MTMREEFEAWAETILGDNPRWRESGEGELARQAWQAATAAEREPENVIRLALMHAAFDESRSTALKIGEMRAAAVTLFGEAAVDAAIRAQD